MSNLNSAQDNNMGNKMISLLGRMVCPQSRDTITVRGSSKRFNLELIGVASPNHFDSRTPAASWVEANRLLASGGSLNDAAMLLEVFLQRARQEDYLQLQITDIEAWSLLGRTYAMNEKEEKALAAFEEGRRNLQGEDAGRYKQAGEMLTVNFVLDTCRLLN